MKALVLICVLACAAGAQSNGQIVTSASREVALTPDEANFSVTISGTLDITEQQVLQLLQSAGVQNRTITTTEAASSTYGEDSTAGHSYFAATFTVSPSAMAAVSGKLDALRSKPPAGITGVQYDAKLNVSEQAVSAARQGVLRDLIRDARNKAQSLALASGLRLGAILGSSDASGLYLFAGPSLFPTAVVRAGDFSAPTASGTIRYTFQLSVTFGIVTD